MNHSNRKRGEVKSSEELTKQAEFSARVNSALEKFFKVRNGWKTSEKTLDELLDYSSKMMALLSEHPTIFNFREDLIEAKIQQSLVLFKKMSTKEFEAEKDTTDENSMQVSHETAGETIQTTCQDVSEDKAQQNPVLALVEFFKDEMKMLVGLAMKDPKCYQLWFHRKWILKTLFKIEQQLGQDGGITRKFFEGDIQICDKFLAKDERNFHAWNYRSFLVRFLLKNFEVDTLKILERELVFLRSKLETNFSNYSAIHYLTKYLVLKEQRLLKESGKNIRKEDIRLSVELLKSEQEFLIQGLFIVPFEQSLWIYQDWILNYYTIFRVIDVKITEGEVIVIFNHTIKEGMFQIVNDAGIHFTTTSIAGNKLVFQVGVVESLEVRVLPAEQLDSGTKIFPGCLLSLDLQGKTAQWAHHEASELERQVLELWQVSIENVKSLVETEGDKREVILNFCTLNAKYFLLCGKLSDYEEKKIQLLENLEKLKTTLDGAHPIISATWEQIDNLKFACS